MGTYSSTSCGNCGQVWQNMESGRNSSFGSPIIKCRACHSLNESESKLYRDMNLFEKGFFWSGQIFLNGLIYGIGGILMGLHFIDRFDMLERLVQGFGFYSAFMVAVFFAFMGYGVSNIYGLIKLLSTIKKIQALYDKNGGFLWSNEEF